MSEVRAADLTRVPTVSHTSSGPPPPPPRSQMTLSRITGPLVTTLYDTNRTGFVRREPLSNA